MGYGLWVLVGKYIRRQEMIPSVILEGRLMMSQEMDYCEDYFPEKNDECESQNDMGLTLGYRALLVL